MEENKDQDIQLSSTEEVKPVKTKTEIGFGTLLNDTWELFQKKFWNTFGLVLLISIVSAITVTVTGLMAFALVVLFSTLKLPMFTAAIAAVLGLGIAVLLLWLNTWQMVAVIEYLHTPEKRSVKELLEQSRPTAVKLLPLAIISFLVIFAGLLLFIVPGVILAVSLAFIYVVAVLEKKGPWEAMQTSAMLVKGRWWNVFVLLAGFIILALAAVTVTGWYFSPLWLLIGPVGYVLMYVLYQHLQKDREVSTTENTRGAVVYKALALFGALVMFIGIVTFAASGAKISKLFLYKMIMKNKYSCEMMQKMDPEYRMQMMQSGDSWQKQWKMQKQWPMPMMNQPMDGSNSMQYQIIFQ